MTIYELSAPHRRGVIPLLGGFSRRKRWQYAIWSFVDMTFVLIRCGSDVVTAFFCLLQQHKTTKYGVEAVHSDLGSQQTWHFNNNIISFRCASITTWFYYQQQSNVRPYMKCTSLTPQYPASECARSVGDFLAHKSQRCTFRNSKIHVK